MIKPFLSLLLLSAGLAFFNYAINPNAPTLRLRSDEVTIQTVAKLGPDILIVDARNPSQFAQSHISGAINLSEEQFDSQLGNFLDAWEPESTILIYCNAGSCNSSRHIADRLKTECGIENIYILKDDWTQWKR